MPSTTTSISFGPGRANADLSAGAISPGSVTRTASIPSDFDAPHPKPFDGAYMQELYERARKMARGGYPWAKSPPEFVVEARR